MQTIKLFFVWAWVAMPLGWGVYDSLSKALPLFGANAPVKSAVKAK